MLDVLGILVSGLAMLFVIYRAVQLDAALPWFSPQEDTVAEAGASGADRSGQPSTVRPIERRPRSPQRRQSAP